ncbi:MAG: alkaline phosphatase family protein [Gemmatimonadota bacterium]|nr:alkaline phosphatase family protein [Gemmatimonadota bacterium]
MIRSVQSIRTTFVPDAGPEKFLLGNRKTRITSLPVIVLLADGARPDTLRDAIDSGATPALARLRADGEMRTVSTVFPSVTGPAYTPFLLGRFPGPLGLPGLRWYDRARSRCSFPHFTRSYLGAQMRLMDGDLAPEAATVWELTPSKLGAMHMIGRGLRRTEQLGYGRPLFMLRVAQVHFRGSLQGWIDIDRRIASDVARHIRERRPAFVFAAFTGVDKSSHSLGHAHPQVTDALKIVDEAAAEIRADAERAGVWDETHIWVSSDHGHSSVRNHDDLAGAIQGEGYKVIGHPWVYGSWDVAVMVSGNAMAHLYVERELRSRPWWPSLAKRWEPLAAFLLDRSAVDLLLLPHSPERCEVRAAGGTAMIERIDGMFSYRPTTGDPLGIGEQANLSSDESHDVCGESDYPDALAQIIALAGSSRAGDIILSAKRDWDLRAKYEPIPHLSAHGALHREHMLVPLLSNRPFASSPRRTADVMPSALRALGLPVPNGLDGEAFV